MLNLFMPVVMVIAIVSYLLGSLVMGVLYSWARKDDIRSRDLPGGSGIYRQYGQTAALFVVFGDVLKGALAVAFARWLAPEWTWVATFFVTLGHCYPIFFRFRGGGGIAPFLGAILVAAPITLLGMLASALLLIVLYKATLQKRFKLNAIPAVTPFAVIIGLALSIPFGGLADLLAGGVAMALRAVQLVRQPNTASQKD